MDGDKRNFADALVAGTKEVVLKLNGEDIKFFAKKIGFLESQNIAVKATAEGKNSLALLIEAAVEDEKGNKFTYDEACKLKREFAEPLFTAVIEINGIGEAEKN